MEFFDTIINNNQQGIQNPNDILRIANTTNDTAKAGKPINDNDTNDAIYNYLINKVDDDNKLIIPQSFIKTTKNYLNDEEKQIKNKKINFYQMYENIEKNLKKRVKYALKI